ncbi:tryptophan dimethylallyltransferase-domain-containing protein [Infundibulicybe gibba]|nr:tryptophan dimethylallyltransferase-domain-containing protein [Infundibulicybe gibba]
MLSTAKYPIRAQASHLIFWWARLGGMMVGHPILCTSDGSLVEFSWVLPRGTDPSGENNRGIRFCIEPFHPETCTRMSGGAVLDWLWSTEGNMGLIKQESMEWKNTIEKWLYPKSRIQMSFPLRRLVADLHPSLQEPCQILCEYLNTQIGASALRFIMIACDVTKLEKNRLKLYFMTPKITLKDIIYDMTLGGMLTGPLMEDAMLNFKKLFLHLFPYVENECTHIVSEPGGPPGTRESVRVMYYYEFFVGHPTPFPKVYFFMDRFSNNDLETARSVEYFLGDVGKRGKEGWLPTRLPMLKKRNGLPYTMVSFGTKPTGWEVTTYYSAEIYALERDSEVGSIAN